MNAEDRRMLVACLEWAEAQDEPWFDARAFEQMLRRDKPLSTKQAAWVRDVYAKLFDEVVEPVVLFSSGQIPRGREVETPEVLRNLPKKPPGARAT